MEMKGKIWQPADQKLPDNEHQGESGLGATERPFTHGPAWGTACRDDGSLAVDGVRALLQLTAGPRRQRPVRAGGQAGHLVYVTVDGKDHNRRQAETRHAKEHGENPSVVTVAPVARAACGADGAPAAVGRPPERRSQPQRDGGHPHRHHHRRSQLQRHLDLVAHGVDDVVVTLHTDGCDGEDGGSYEGDVEEDVDPALRHGQLHAGQVRRARNNPERHEQDGAQQVHCAQVADKGKLPEMGSFYDND